MYSSTNSILFPSSLPPPKKRIYFTRYYNVEGMAKAGNHYLYKYPLLLTINYSFLPSTCTLAFDKNSMESSGTDN